jgi:hypothetical protein
MHIQQVKQYGLGAKAIVGASHCHNVKGKCKSRNKNSKTFGLLTGLEPGVPEAEIRCDTNALPMTCHWKWVSNIPQAYTWPLIRRDYGNEVRAVYNLRIYTSTDMKRLLVTR